MGENALGEYIEEMRRRHPRLSKRRMAIEAGINESAVQQIVSGRTGASPATLKALADRWGTQKDYKNLLILAGHELPVETNFDAEQQDVARQYGLVDDATKRRVREILHGYATDEAQGPEMNDKWKFLERFTFDALREIVRSLTPEERQRLIVEFLEFLRRQEEDTGHSADRAGS